MKFAAEVKYYDVCSDFFNVKGYIPSQDHESYKEDQYLTLFEPIANSYDIIFFDGTSLGKLKGRRPQILLSML